MSLTFKQAKNSNTWQDFIAEESESSLRRRRGIRKSTFRRMYLSVFILVTAGFTLYCSLFYVGAFIDMGKIVGFSQSNRVHHAQQNIKPIDDLKPRTALSPIIEAFMINRIYMRKGQSIIATYSLPTNAELFLSVRQCKSQPLLEIFNCRVLGAQNAVINNRSKGFKEFIVSEPGFYYFEEKVVKLPNKNLKAFLDYRIIWYRGG